jgi:hypothetical protein
MAALHPLLLIALAAFVWQGRAAPIDGAAGRLYQVSFDQVIQEVRAFMAAPGGAGQRALAVYTEMT